MISGIVIGHGPLAPDLVSLLEEMVGPQRQMASFSIENETDIQTLSNEILSTISNLDDGDGFIVFVDMFGGVPSNIGVSLLKAGVSDLVAGVNLPMLIKFAGVRTNLSVIDCVDECISAGRRFITQAFKRPKKPIEASLLAEENFSIEINNSKVIIDEIEIISDQISAQSDNLSWSEVPLGHNNPPDDAAIALADIEAVRLILATELSHSRPRSRIVDFCIGVLKSSKAAVDRIASWLQDKGDVFANEAFKAAGSAVGKAIVALPLWVLMGATLSRLIETLEQIVTRLP